MGSPNKRMRIFRHLKTLKTDVALLQETHLKKEDYFRLKKLWVGEVYGSPAKGRNRGVITPLHKNCKYKSRNEEIDETGRRLIIQPTPVGTQEDTTPTC